MKYYTQNQILEKSYNSVWDLSLEVIQNIRIDNREIVENLEKKEFQNCFFKEADFTKSEFYKNTFCNVIFEHCNLSNIDFSNNSFHGCFFINCNIVGTNFSKSYCDHVHFTNCKGNYVSFYQAKMKFIWWKQNDFTSSNLSDMTPLHIEIDQCNFTDSEFFKTPLKNLDLSNSKIDQIHIGNEELEGVFMNIDQALAFAKRLGIQIK